MSKEFEKLVAALSLVAGINMPKPVEAQSLPPPLPNPVVTVQSSPEAEKEVIDFLAMHNINLTPISREERPDLYKAIDAASEKIARLSGEKKMLPKPDLYQVTSDPWQKIKKLEYGLVQNVDRELDNSFFSEKGSASFIAIPAGMLATLSARQLSDMLEKAMIEANERVNFHLDNKKPLHKFEASEALDTIFGQKLIEKYETVEEPIKSLSRGDAPEIFAMMDRIYQATIDKADQLGITNIPPYPKFYVRESSQINASAVAIQNLFPEDSDGYYKDGVASAIIVNRGFLALPPGQIEAVIAHEWTHDLQRFNPDMVNLNKVPTEAQIEEATGKDAETLYHLFRPHDTSGVAKLVGTSPRKMLPDAPLTPDVPPTRAKETNADYGSVVLTQKPADLEQVFENFAKKDQEADALVYVASMIRQGWAKELPPSRREAIENSALKETIDFLVDKNAHDPHLPDNLRIKVVEQDAKQITPPAFSGPKKPGGVSR